MKVVEKLSKLEFTISLSAGYFGFFAHCGFIKAIESEGLKPRMITGSSSGAIVASCVASGMKASEMEKEFLLISKGHFFDPAFGFGLIKGNQFEKTLNQYLVSDFSETVIPLQVATFNINNRKTEIFSSGKLAPVVRASCAIPIFFQPVKIGKHFYWDGGIQDKMGWSGVSDSELILGHQLKSDPVSYFFEKKNLRSKKNQLLLKIPKLPPTGPGNFANGAKSIALTYELTKKYLSSELVENLI
jgi:NTE family protein